MIDEKEPNAKPKKPKNVIACLTEGFDIVARRPQLAFLPFLLDLYLWLGPRLSLEPLLRELQQLLRASLTSGNAETTTQLLHQILEEAADVYNLFSLLEPFPLLGLPTFMGQRLTVTRPLGPRSVIPVESITTALGWVCVIVIVELGLSAFYLWRIGVASNETTEESSPPPPSTPAHIWGSLLKLTLWLLAALLMLSIPGMLIVMLTSFISIGFSGFVLILFFSGGLFTLLHTLYTVPGIVQFSKPPLQALQESIILTQTDFPGTLSLLLVILVMSQGLNFVWALPEPESWITLVGIGGHAVVSTALMTTLFIFYRERLRYLKALQKLYAVRTAHSSEA
ncbi:MAG: hypothetical protein ACP5HM_06395 [Anaerolineae bacterium]